MPTVAASAVAQAQVAPEDELVLGFFSTGTLVLQQGKTVMHLNIEQRGKLADFLNLVAP